MQHFAQSVTHIQEREKGEWLQIAPGMLSEYYWTRVFANGCMLVRLLHFSFPGLTTCAWKLMSRGIHSAVNADRAPGIYQFFASNRLNSSSFVYLLLCTIFLWDTAHWIVFIGTLSIGTQTAMVSKTSCFAIRKWSRIYRLQWTRSEIYCKWTVLVVSEALHSLCMASLHGIQACATKLRQ